MKKTAILVAALLLAGGAHALTSGRLVKASSTTYITDSIIRDNGTGVAIGTTPVAGSSLTVMGTVFIGTTTAAPVLGSYGTLLAIGSLANSPGLLFQGPTQRWGVRAGSTMDFNEETTGLTVGSLSTAGNWSVTSLTAQSLAPSAVGTDLNLSSPGSASDVVTGAIILKPGVNGSGVGQTASITITGAHVVGAGTIQGSSVTIVGGGVNIPATTVGGDINISGGSGRDASGGTVNIVSGAATHSSGASGNIRLDIAAGAGSTGQTIFRVNGSTVATVSSTGLSVVGTITASSQGSQTVYAAAVSSSVTNTASETSITPTGGGGTLVIPAGRLAVGTAVRICLYGDYTTTGSPPTSATFKIKIGSTFFHTFVISHPPASQSAAPWKIDATYVVRSTGAGGTISGAAFLTMMNAASASPYVSNTTFDGATNTGASSIDTTIANTVDTTVTWSSAVASNTMRAAAMTVEVLN